MTIKSLETSAASNLYEVIEDCGVIAQNEKSTILLRVVKWAGRPAKYDIRPWWKDKEGREKCGKGISLTGPELESLRILLNAMAEKSE